MRWCETHERDTDPGVTFCRTGRYREDCVVVDARVLTRARTEELRVSLPDLIYDTWTNDPKHFDSYAMERSRLVANAVLDAIMGEDSPFDPDYQMGELG